MVVEQQILCFVCMHACVCSLQYNKKEIVHFVSYTQKVNIITFFSIFFILYFLLLLSYGKSYYDPIRCYIAAYGKIMMMMIMTIAEMTMFHIDAYLMCALHKLCV